MMALKKIEKKSNELINSTEIKKNRTEICEDRTNTVTPPYPQGIYSKAPIRCLKLT